MRKTAMLILLIAVALVSGCVSYGSRPQPNASQPPSGTNAVTIQNFAFSPAALAIRSGTTVTWTNMDSAPHTITSDGGAFSSAQLSNGGSFSHAFSQPGTFDYHCSVHPYMKAKIIVQ